MMDHDVRPKKDWFQEKKGRAVLALLRAKKRSNDPGQENFKISQSLKITSEQLGYDDVVGDGDILFAGSPRV